MELEGKLKMKFPYNVDKPTYVYVYAGEGPAAASRRIFATRGEKPSLKVYGISVSTDSFIKGDANRDGVVDEKDVNTIVSHIMGGIPENFDEEAADLNGDKKVNVADIVELNKLLAPKD